MLLLSAFAANANYSKSIHKSWPISKVKALAIENKFGNINFISNRDDSVTIDVHIEIENPSAKKAEYLADQIQFLFALNDGKVHAQTKFGDNFKTNQNFTIQYTINIPTDRDLEVENRYGNVTLGDLYANGYFEIKYGNIYGRNLKAPDDSDIKLELSYGQGTFASIKKLLAEVGYSTVDFGDMHEANLESQYSVVKIGTSGDLNIESKFDTYKVKSVNDLYAESKFSGWDIINLNNSFELENEYGSIDVGNVNKQFELINIENKYGNINVGVSSDASYQLESESYYCNVSYPEAEEIKHITENNRTYIKAIIGNHNSETKVKIETRYGKVNLVK